jgi:hypothetical protein
MHSEKVNSHNLTVAAAVIVVMLVGTALISITALTVADAFARNIKGVMQVKLVKQRLLAIPV